MSILAKGVTGIVNKILDDFSAGQVLKLALIIVMGWFVYHMAKADGMIPGESGYAKQDDMYQMRLTILNDNFVKAQQKVCEMLVAHNQEATKYASQKRAELQNELRKLTGYDPQLPSCAELGVGE